MEDDTEFVAAEHDHLISAISRLDKTQHISEPSRSELSIINSEFNLVKRSSKLNINNVVKVLEDTAHHVQISKKLKKSSDSSKVLTKPLEKPQSERIKRSTGYQQTKTKVGRWDAVVARARTADYVSFPLKQIDTKSQTTKDFLSKLKLKSQLEKELEEVDPPVAQDVQEDEEQVYPMSYEMIEHRQHLAKFRAQQSYKAAKAKRQSKIKSKKYHRILKKERLKQQLKEFEELQKTNPEEALKKLEVLEKTRALERHTLRHKNTGKWAKSKLVRAKYNKEVRQQLAEQLAVSRGLTHKTKDIESSDDEGDENENIPDITLVEDPLDPWHMKSNTNSEFDFGYKKYIKDEMYNRQDSDSETEIENTQVTELRDNVQFTPTLKKHRNENIDKPQSKLVATSNWTVESIENNTLQPKGLESITEAFETYEGKINKKVEKKLKRLRNDIDKINKKPVSRIQENKQTDVDEDNLEHLYLKKKKTAVIDEELIETDFQTDKDVEDKNNSVQHLLRVANTTINENVNGNESTIIHEKAKYLRTTVTGDENAIDQLDDDDEQVVPKLISGELFEDDDIVASFRQEKEDEINEGKPQDVDLSLPGWGSWGGKGVVAPKRKKNRFILKAAPQMPRRDENKGDIIIKEYKDPKLASHKVSDIPYPFNTIKEYEASIRAPIGSTFIPEKAHQKLIRPSVITKSGTIIEPMDEEELLLPKNRKFKNSNVLSIIHKK